MADIITSLCADSENRAIISAIPHSCPTITASVTANTGGEPEMHLHGRKGAGVLSSLTGADGLVEIPVENTGVAVGDYLPFIPFRESGL